MKPICPICKKELTITANPNIFSCIKRETEIYGHTIEYVDSALCFDICNNVIFQMYEVPPYRFRIHDAPDIVRTTIDKIKLIEVVYSPFKKDSYRYKEIIRLPFTISLPWDNCEKVLEKVKKYLIFS